MRVWPEKETKQNENPWSCWEGSEGVWLELNWHLVLGPRDEGSGGRQAGPQAEIVGERGMLSQRGKCCFRDRVQERWGPKQLVPGNHNRDRVLSRCWTSHKRAARENTGWGPRQTEGRENGGRGVARGVLPQSSSFLRVERWLHCTSLSRMLQGCQLLTNVLFPWP